MVIGGVKRCVYAGVLDVWWWLVNWYGLVRFITWTVIRGVELLLSPYSKHAYSVRTFEAPLLPHHTRAVALSGSTLFGRELKVAYA